MRRAIVFTIFRKEIIETLRDRRTLIFSFVLPVLLYPVLSLSLAKVQESHVVAQQAKVSTIAAWGEVTPELQDWLRKTNFMIRAEAGKHLPADLARELPTLKPPASEDRKSTRLNSSH